MGRRGWKRDSRRRSCTMFRVAAGAAQRRGRRIKVGHLADLTGATGDVGEPYAEGVQACKDTSTRQRRHQREEDRHADVRLRSTTRTRRSTSTRSIRKTRCRDPGLGDGRHRGAGRLSLSSVKSGTWFSPHRTPLHLTDPRRPLQLLLRGRLHARRCGRLRTSRKAGRRSAAQDRLHLPEPPVRHRADQGREGSSRRSSGSRCWATRTSV